MGWTRQQQQAIEARNTSLIVSAAAGSGKTTVLTERIVQLLADADSGVRADRIIVVTFTNDAAAELKKRLDNKLRLLINDHPDDKHLLKQQILLQSARISTINSFCFDLIRDNMPENGITSAFGVLDDTDNKVLKAQAMEELINYYSENEYEKISAIYDKFCIKDEKRLIEAIDLTDSFLASVPFRDLWLDKAVKMYETDFAESEYYHRLIEDVTKKLKKALAVAEGNISMISSIFPDMSAKDAKKSFAQAEEDRDRVEQLLAMFGCGLPSYDEMNEISRFSMLVRVGKEARHNSALRDIFKKRREIIKKTIEKAINSTLSAESDYEECAEVTALLTEMLRKYQEIIWAKKCEKNALSFDDGERIALEILCTVDEKGNILRSETASSIAEYYDIIMIDEYQDSNNKQDLIFKMLSKNYGVNKKGEPLYGDNVFLVGDVKQSIYRFRLANPQNFINTLENSQPYKKESSEKNQSIVLNMNFRSSPEVIGAVNYIFSQIMTVNCGDIDYNDDEKLYFGSAEQYTPEDNKRLTTITFINNDSDDETDQEETSDVNHEAIYTASVIAKMISSEEEVSEKDGTQRPCRPSDFCILVRKNSYINTYADELNRAGVPAKGNEEMGYLRSREIAVLIDLLRIISNPLQDIPMAAVMTSPMYMFSISDISVIRSFDTERPLFSVIRDIAGGNNSECTDMLLIKRCADFLVSLDTFRLNSVTMSIGELISEIYDTTDFISVMQLYSDGNKKRANLRALIQYAQNYEASASFDGTGGLDGFLRHLDRVMENGDYAQGKVSASAGDYVTVQTFHRSKGLEYPFVFIAETSTQFQSDSEIVMCNTDGRMGYVLYDPKLYRKYKTFQQSMLSAEEEAATRSEEMRLLYVGLTRAQQKLFINLKCGEKSLKRVNGIIDSAFIHYGDIDEAVCEAKSFSDWIWASIIREPDFFNIADKIGIEASLSGIKTVKSNRKLFDYTVADNIERYIPLVEADAEEPEPDPRIVNRINDIISFEYDKTLSETPAKFSVTQIATKLKAESEHFDFRLRRPKFKMSGEKLTGSERGTAIHTFFQYCDFESAVINAENEIDSVVEKGYISSEEGKSIDLENVRAFFDGSLYSRLCRARNYIREKKFMVSVSDIDINDEIFRKFEKSDGMIKGIVDLMFEEDDGIVIVDYKSDRGVSLEMLKERYSVQLLLYKAAIELTTGKKVKEALLYSFEKRAHIAVDF